jgi:peptidoglycan LD-endopeptidase LytH
MHQKLKKFLFTILGFIFLGYAIPNNAVSPIEKNAITKIDPESFWYYPWGESIVHKGIDIFCDGGTNILSPVSGFIVNKGNGTISGNYIYILGSKWRTYYFAHMDTIFVNSPSYISKGDIIGKVGIGGNAKNKPSHLHYSIETLLPYFWLYDSKAVQGWKKMFYLNPKNYLNFNEIKNQ